MSADPFDPYLEWLGVPSGDRPPDHYRLLGLPRFESDRRAIEVATEARMCAVHQHKSGPHAEHARRLLAELAAAKVCLCYPDRKAAYDATLRDSTAMSGPPREPNASGWRPAPLRLDDEPNANASGASEPSPPSGPKVAFIPAAGASRLMPPGRRSATSESDPRSPASSVEAPAVADHVANGPMVPLDDEPGVVASEPLAPTTPVAHAVPVARAIPVATAVDAGPAEPNEDDFSEFGERAEGTSIGARSRRRGSGGLVRFVFLVVQIVIGGALGAAAGFWVLQKARTGELRIPFFPSPPGVEASAEATPGAGRGNDGTSP